MSDDFGDGDGGWGGGSVVWRARLFLFMGFALMAGGLAGSIVSSLSGDIIFGRVELTGYGD